MIYLDNSATTFPKPQIVRRAMNEAVSQYGANPGRSGHNMAIRASEEMYRCRSLAAGFFGAESPDNVVFTLNCTHAVNIVLKGLLHKGDHVVISDMEHNAVVRPLHALKERGVSYTIAKVSVGDPEKTLASFRNALRDNTKLVVCTHVSNVWGIRLPIERITAMCHQYGIEVLVDASQSAGVLPINIGEVGIDYLCTAGHKGLYSPMGAGLLITSKGEVLHTFIEGGTGSNSAIFEQPGIMPDRFESGTQNLPAIAGLRAGIEFVTSVTPEKIHLHEIMLLDNLYDRIHDNKNVILYTPRPGIRNSGGVLSFNIKDTDSETAAEYLNTRYGIAVRAGLHCAPLAHKHFGTEEQGTVRVSPSYFTSIRDITILSQAINSYK